MITGRTILKWYNESKDQTKKWREEAREMFDLRAGVQWTEKEEAELKEKRRLPIVMNRAGPFIDSVRGYAENNRKEMRFLPRENGDLLQTELLSEGVRWADDLCCANDEVLDAFEDMVICGMGWTETRMDYKIDQDGRLITAERIDPFEMFWDIHATKRNLSDARYLLRARRYTREDAEKRWPKIKTVVPVWDNEEDFKVHDATEAWKYINDYGDSHTGADTYLILQCQWFEDKTVYRVADPQSGKLVTFSEAKFEKLREGFDSMGIRYVKGTKRYYYQSWSTSEYILEEGLAPSQEGFTLKAMCGKRDRNSKMFYGMMRSLKDPQKFSNKFFSDIMYILATNRKGGAFVETDALVDPRKAEEDWAKPDVLIKLNPGGLDRIRERDAGLFPTGLDRLMQYAIDAVQATSGVNPEMMGMADRAQAGILEEHRKEAGITILAPLFAAMHRHTRERGPVVADMLIKYIADGRLIRITGIDGQQAQQPLILPDALTYDVIVDEVSNTPNQRKEVVKTLVALAPLLQQTGTPLPPDIVEYLPLPNTMIQKMKQAAAQPPPPDPKIELERMKLEAQMEEAKIRAELDRMKLQNEQAKISQQGIMEDQKNQIQAKEMQLDAALKQAELRLKAIELQIKEYELQVKSETQNLENITDIKVAEIQLEASKQKGKRT